MNNFYKFLDAMANGLNKLATGTLLSGTWVAAGFNNLAAYIKIKVNNGLKIAGSGMRSLSVPKILPPNLNDTFTITTAAFTAALTAISKEAPESNPFNTQVQAGISSVLAAMSFVSDRQAHNEKVKSFESERLDTMDVLQLLLPLIDKIIVRDQLSTTSKSILVSHVERDGLQHYWKNCYSLEVTLKTGGSIVFNNINHAANSYRVKSNIAMFAAGAFNIARLYYICSGAWVQTTSVSTTPTLDTTSDINRTLNIIGAIPVHLTVDLTSQIFSMKTKRIKTFFESILNDLEMELARAKSGRATNPHTISELMVKLFSDLNLSDDMINKAETLRLKFAEHNRNLVDIELAMRANTALSLQQQLDILSKEKDEIISVNNLLRNKIQDLTGQKDALITSEMLLKKERDAANIKSSDLQKEVMDLKVELEAQRQKLAATILRLNEVQLELTNTKTQNIQDKFEASEDLITELATTINNLGNLMSNADGSKGDYHKLMLEHLTVALEKLLSKIDSDKKFEVLQRLQSKLDSASITYEIQSIFKKFESELVPTTTVGSSLLSESNITPILPQRLTSPSRTKDGLPPILAPILKSPQRVPTRTSSEAGTLVKGSSTDSLGAPSALLRRRSIGAPPAESSSNPDLQPPENDKKPGLR